MKNVYLFQPQYPTSFDDEIIYWIPYSAGCIWSYVAQFPEISNNFELKDIIFKRMNPDELVNSLDNPTICAFSCYIWNENYSLAVAKMIKDKWPECIIIFGGPQVSSKMLEHTFIDSLSFAEGELAFLTLLQEVLYHRPISKFIKNQRISNLDTLVSPLTTGVFDKIIVDNPKIGWAMVLETNRGCPYACTFCDWGSIIQSKIKKFALERVEEDLNWIIGKNVKYILCSDANFGIFKERDLEIAKMIHNVSKKSNLNGVSLQFTKNSTEHIFKIASEIKDIGKGITLSVQSMNEPTLKAIKRQNMNVNDLSNMLRLGKEYNVITYTELIIGLPLETLETWKTGISQVIEFGQHNTIDVYFSILLANSEMSDPSYIKKYGIESIVTNEVMPLYYNNYTFEIMEDVEIVNATNTMSSTDIINGYLYAWVVIHCHMAGYSQLIARYCREKLNISYRQFYDRLHDYIVTDEIFSTHYNDMYNNVHDYVTIGKTTGESRGGQGLLSEGYKVIYENKDRLYDLSWKVCNDLTNKVPDDRVLILQQKWMINQSEDYPIIVDAINIENWTEDQKYKISTNLSEKDFNNFDFYISRRKGALKNRMLAIDTLEVK